MTGLAASQPLCWIIYAGNTYVSLKVGANLSATLRMRMRFVRFD
jgi:hypothetical protein